MTKEIKFHLKEDSKYEDRFRIASKILGKSSPSKLTKSQVRNINLINKRSPRAVQTPQVLKRLVGR